MRRVIFLLLLLCFAPAAFSQEAADVDVIRTNDVAALEGIVASNGVDACHVYGENGKYGYLALAIKAGAMDSFEYIMKQNPDVNLICQDKTPLMYAVKYDRPEMLEVLLDHGADPEMKSKNGRSALHYAKKYEKAGMVDRLREVVG